MDSILLRELPPVEDVDAVSTSSMSLFKFVLMSQEWEIKGGNDLLFSHSSDRVATKLFS